MFEGRAVSIQEQKISLIEVDKEYFMNKLSVFFKQLRLRQLVTAVLATVVLFASTACNSGDVRGARPDNPPVQAGGANNPYKDGGDTNTNFRFSADPKVSKDATTDAIKSKGERSDLQIISDRLIAAGDAKLYPGGNELQGRPADEQKELPIIKMQDFETAEAGGQIQRESSIGDRIKDRLSTVKEQFEEASEFISADAEEALERHEAVPQPGLR
jgi:hypothetical protein